MIFAGIDVNIITHEKADAAGVEAFGLWCWAMCWAQVHESDGRVPRNMVLRALSGRRNVILAQRLVDAGLWRADDDGSWTIGNYAKKNQTKEEIQKRKEAAKLRKDEWKARQTGERNANGTRSGTPKENVPEQPLPPSPPIQPAPPPADRIGTDAAPPVPPPEPKSGSVSRRKPETPCPGSDSEPDAVNAWANVWKLPTEHPEFAGFLDHHRKGDARWRDWAAAWRTWLRNASKFGQRGGPGREPPRQKLGAAVNAPWMDPNNTFDFQEPK